MATVHVTDAFNHPVRGALAQIVGLPFGAVQQPAETAPGTDGTVAFKLTAGPQPQGAGGAIALQVRARKPGDDVLTGVTGTRLVKLSVGS
jgi:hypothetical protein